GARDRAAADLGGGDPGGHLRRAAHHPRPGPVGERPGRLGGDRGADAPGLQYPGHRALARRRGQAGAGRRAGPAPEAAAGPQRRPPPPHLPLTVRWELLSPAIIVGTALVPVALERRFPYSKGEKILREGFWTDLVLYR